MCFIWYNRCVDSNAIYTAARKYFHQATTCVWFITTGVLIRYSFYQVATCVLFDTTDMLILLLCKHCSIKLIFLPSNEPSCLCTYSWLQVRVRIRVHIPLQAWFLCGNSAHFWHSALSATIPTYSSRQIYIYLAWLVKASVWIAYVLNSLDFSLWYLECFTIFVGRERLAFQTVLV